MSIPAAAQKPSPPEAGKIANIRSQTREDLRGQFAVWREPAYRVDQLLEWLYTRRVTSWDAMTNLPKALRQRLQLAYSFHSLELARHLGARDTTQKFLWRLWRRGLDRNGPDPGQSRSLRGGERPAHAVCVHAGRLRLRLPFLRERAGGLETQPATPMKLWSRCWPSSAGMPPCRLRPPARRRPRPARGLSTIWSSWAWANRWPITKTCCKRLRILNAPWGGGIGARRITLSTSGLAPQIRRLAEEPQQFRLAISLHGATDETRGRIMPVNKKYPLSELAAAARYYQEKKGGLITLEYILIAGVNDGLDQIKPLAALARRLGAKVNLIPYNTVEGLPWARPEEAVQENFLAALEREKVTATLRREKGHDIDAACGQLRLKTERELVIDRP